MRLFAKMRARSVLNLVPVLAVFHMARQTGFVWAPHMGRFVQDRCSGVLATKMIEDGNRLQRSEEQSNWNNQVADSRKYGALFTSQLATREHRYNEVSTTENPCLDRNVPTKVPGLYRARATEHSVDLKAVKGTTAKAPWPSPQPQNHSQQQVDIAFIVHLHANKCWHLGQDSWASLLFRVYNLLVCNEDVCGGGFFCYH